ncbi:MAG: NHLP bacteriocin export ABC transporter permease/ATPase subunit, partial [Reyranella sp.]|nr:NHLP bacteriocin export ABC transporter permease/ATPase subunit [Reyranella sp.]
MTDTPPAAHEPLELAGLAGPCRLARPARLYGAVIDSAGSAGQRRFLAELPEGAAVFALSSPRVVFVLTDGTASSDPPALVDGPIGGPAIDAEAIDAWYAALLSCPGPGHGHGDAIPFEPGDRRTLEAGARLTARRVAWLRASVPILRYPGPNDSQASRPTTLLVVANQIGAETVAAGEVEEVETATLLVEQTPATLGQLSAVLAERVAARLVEDEAAEEQRRLDADALDKARANAAMQRLRDIAAFRFTTIDPTVVASGDALARALAVIGRIEGFTLQTPDADDPGSALFERLERFANASGFRFREIALDGDWWNEDGPAFLGIEAASGQALAVVWRRGRWRAIGQGAPGHGASGETVIDKASAASLLTRGYMIYAPLPERFTTRELIGFATFGVGGDIFRLLLASAAVTLAGLLLPVAAGAILGTAIPQGRLLLLSDMLLLLGATAIGSALFQVVRALALIRVGTHLDRRLQPAVWDRLIRLRASFFRDYSVGDLALRVLGVDAIRRTLSGVAVTAAVGGLFSVASLVLMLIYDPILTMFAFGYAIVAASLLFLLARRQARLDRVVYTRKGIVSGLLIEILGGIAKLRVGGAELRAFSRWSEAFAEQRINSARSGRVAAYQTVLGTSLPIVGSLGIFWLAAGGSNPISIGDFAAFNSAFGQFTGAMLSLAGALNAGIEVVPLFARLRPVFDAPLEVGQDRVDPGPLGGHIAVHNLSFRYGNDGPWILQDVAFEARPGESVAIVGASGSGKSTLLRLLLGFETPTHGGIFYDDRDLEKLDLGRVRQQIGTVLENSRLVPGSLHDNIVGAAPLSQAQIDEAVRQAGLAADIETMPMGLQTFVMEGGGQISGGQRQRVMIARAIVRKPRILLFDEATSALDNRTQAIVTASLAAMNATRLVIAHRLST